MHAKIESQIMCSKLSIRNNTFDIKIRISCQEVGFSCIFSVRI